MALDNLDGIANVAYDVVEGFDPSDVSGYTWHVDATEISGKDDGDSLDTWSDQAGSNDATAPGSTERPTYRDGGINGNPSVEFASSNELELDSRQNFTHDGSSWTLFVVIHPDSNMSGNYGGVWGSNHVSSGDKGSGIALDFRSEDGGAHNIIANGDDFVIDGRTSDNVYEDQFSPAIITVRHDTSDTDDWEFWSNQSKTQTENEKNSYTSDSSTNRPAICGTGVDGYEGHVGEMILYNEGLSTEDRNDVEDHLADKWGITL